MTWEQDDLKTSTKYLVLCELKLQPLNTTGHEAWQQMIQVLMLM